MKKKDIFTKDNEKYVKTNKSEYKEEYYNNKNNKTNVNDKKKSIEVGIIVGLCVIILVLLTLTLMKKEDKQNNDNQNNDNQNTIKPNQEEVEKLPNLKVVDTKSKTRPYAISINNTPVAVKVQEGLNKAFLVYEIPTEGFTSRLLAIYKDQKDVTVGTIRSARHNFIDYANESDAIFVAYGYSIYAQDALHRGVIDYINGIESKFRSVFWRSNPEKLATEHTAYTSMEKISDYVNKHKYRLESKKSSDTLALKYSESEINLDNIENVKDANSVKLPYGNITTVFKYNKDTKEYTKYVNDKKIKDHKTGENITTKNIIIAKMGYKVMPDKKYWELKNTGTGEGYYITNGKVVPIKWQKDKRLSRTKYTYLNGEEVVVNDGRTYIELFIKSRKITIK